jgi:hypothetical protein
MRATVGKVSASECMSSTAVVLWREAKPAPTRGRGVPVAARDAVVIGQVNRTAAWNEIIGVAPRASPGLRVPPSQRVARQKRNA